MRNVCTNKIPFNYCQRNISNESPPIRFPSFFRSYLLCVVCSFASHVTLYVLESVIRLFLSWNVVLFVCSDAAGLPLRRVTSQGSSGKKERRNAFTLLCVRFNVWWFVNVKRFTFVGMIRNGSNTSLSRILFI